VPFTYTYIHMYIQYMYKHTNVSVKLLATVAWFVVGPVGQWPPNWNAVQMLIRTLADVNFR